MPEITGFYDNCAGFDCFSGELNPPQRLVLFDSIIDILINSICFFLEPCFSETLYEYGTVQNDQEIPDDDKYNAQCLRLKTNREGVQFYDSWFYKIYVSKYIQKIIDSILTHKTEKAGCDLRALAFLKGRVAHA